MINSIEPLLARIHTEPLRRAGVPTVALVVVNTGGTDAPPCCVRFRAAFAVREPLPVTMRDGDGDVVASRIASESVTPHPKGVWWSLTLEFFLPGGITAQSVRTFAAGYELAENPPFPEDLPLREDVGVYETGLHSGDLPLAFVLPSFF